MELYDLEKLNNLPIDQQIKIKKEIINTYELRTIPKEYLPEVSSSEYYFISYSHLDYKRVYSDLFDLLFAGLFVWYDLGIPAGSNWKETATKYLMPFQCKGVIFYLSENALKSQAIINEIEFAKRSKKPIVSIFLTNNENDKLWNLIDDLYNKQEISTYAYELFKEVFNKDILYLTIFDSAKRRKEQIKSSLPRISKLEIDLSRFDEDFGLMLYTYPGIRLIIKSLNDYYANKILEEDFEDLINDEALIKRIKDNFIKRGSYGLFNQDDIYCNDYIIGQSAFSNMKNLEYAEIPIYNDEEIGSCAFAGCTNLKRVKFIDEGGEVNLGNCVFYNCESLEEFDFDNVLLNNACFLCCRSLQRADLSNIQNDDIPSNCFQYCQSLKDVILNNRITTIGSKAFSFTALEEIKMPNLLERIEWCAFYSCEKLKKIILNEGLKEIGLDAFSNCLSLEEIYLPSSLIIAKNCFTDCINLKRIYFNGTVKQMNELTDNDPNTIVGCIDYDTPPVEIICSDGVLYTKGGFKI